MLNFIWPDWPAPKQVKACTTTRHGGVSQGPYTSFNLGLHVEDKPEAVVQNRRWLSEQLALPSEPFWLRQTHSTTALTANTYQATLEADACYSNQPGQVCVSLTADCLPILICNQAGTEIAAIHAGWRGLAHGIIEQTIPLFASLPTQLLAWLGPAIGPTAFAVGADVRDIFIRYLAESHGAFQQIAEQQWLANIYLLARQRLQKLGIQAVYGGNYCTYTDKELFYSYRRDQITGRMASLIWLAQS